MKRIFLIIICYAALGCNAPENVETLAQDSLSLVSEKIEVVTTKDLALVLDSEFKSTVFLSLADSLLKILSNKPVRFSSKLHTIGAQAVQRESFLYALQSTHVKIIKRYSFDTGKGGREMRFWLIEALYEDSLELTKAFNNLKSYAYKNNEPFYLPGLSYANDYVIRTPTKIYWLNSGCTYAFKNHQKLNAF
ncbi:MAG: hypothetical protein IPJ79_09990 [Bacteroidetes bacterium]|nr:hypothetical protein [Bacteroidota bacterium]